MKWLLVLVSFSSLSLSAATKWGSECGLTDSKDETWVQVGRTLDLRSATKKEINALPTLTKQQLIITAKDEAKDRLGHGNPSAITSTVEAVDFLKDNSESEDLQVINYKVNQLKLTEIAFWPGGNPYGHLFLKGTTHVVAFNQDDSVACK